MHDLMTIARKEFRGFFASPAAFLFLGVFLAVTLFVVFWGEAFFARNIADVRPLFEWMPVLLIFLIGALTMRSWSEERRSGTVESLLTSPVGPLPLIGGKFLAGMGLLALALAMTLPLPITVSFIGPLDWGPVIGGYVATLFLGAAYLSIGLFMSSRTDNPIVSLILTTLVCGIFYLLGSSLLTNLFGHQVAHFLEEIGTGSRFDSITRGVIDLRDLYYYVSITGVFLVLNRLSLERMRWAGNPPNRRHRGWTWVCALAIANFVVANAWLTPVSSARADITQSQMYSLSDATYHELNQLHEPLVIRGYFSDKTHPLLAPLVPRIRDLLQEYAIAGGKNVQVQFLDPTKDHDVEEQAASQYGIKPVPFQTASRYQSSVVNAYFNVVVSYGDQYQVLGFRDLIDVKSQSDNKLDVALKSPEYELTRTIHKLVSTYRAGDNAFASIDQPVTFHGYFSSEQKLPKELVQLKGNVTDILKDMAKGHEDKLSVQIEDPDANGGKLGDQLTEQYGYQPRIASLTDPQPFWFNMTLQSGDNVVPVPLPDTLDKAAMKRSIKSALQRLTPGVLKTVTVVAPQDPMARMRQMRGMPPQSQYQKLMTALKDNVRVKQSQLADGKVPAETDLLLVLAPQNLDDKQRFAIDQFLMRGGRIVMATSPFKVSAGRSLSMEKTKSGLEDWLARMGVTIQPKMVLDAQSSSLPVPVTRNVGGMNFREIQMVPYAPFPDLRGDELNPKHPVTRSLDQMTLGWASPITIDQKAMGDRNVTRLLESSPQTWTTDSTQAIPNMNQYPQLGFATHGEPKAQTLAVAIKGQFQSYYADRQSPLAQSADDKGNKNAKNAQGKKQADKPTFTSVIKQSPDSSRLVLIASNAFASDTMVNLVSQELGTVYTKPIDMVQNAIDWSLEDPGLLALRGQTQFARTLVPMDNNTQRFWEYLNYGLAALALLLVWLWRRSVRAGDRRRYQRILAEV
ncbi:ABC transporter permease [Marinobacter sp. R17]|uniref:Gldg family protein n=1 Tax=Marinobacter sp. R17 TaxID=2484250 RepID=UPI000F4C21FF|nr:Gldg family protein [Marinobacter sp. R17]ROU02191.1 ABC transporter permease [Marinobacter sp. R17]